MATAHIKGSSRIAYDPGGGVITHLLAVPLQDIQQVDPQPRFEWWSVDERSREIVTIGGGVREIWATIRMDNDPNGLRALLRAGIQDDVTVTYRHTDLGTAHLCKIVRTDSGEVNVVPDRDRAGFGEWMVRILLRRVDGGSFDDVWS